MFTPFFKVFSLLDARERSRGVWLFALIIVRGMVEVVSIASVTPFIAVASNPALIERNRWLRAAYEAGGFATPRSFMIALCLISIAILVTSTIIGAAANSAVYTFAKRCNFYLSSTLLSRYLHRPYSWYLNQHTSDLGKTVLHDVDHVVNLIVVPSVNLMSKLVASALMVGLVVLVDPLTALTAALAFGGMYGLIFYFSRRRLVALGKQIFYSNEIRFRTAQDCLSGFRDVKVAGLERAYVDRYKEEADRFATADLHYKIIADLPKFLMESLAFGGMLGVLLFLLVTRPGGLAAALPVVAIYAFAGYRLLPALQQIYQSIAMLKVGGESLARLHREMTAPYDVPVADGETPARPRITLTRELRLRAVSYRYPGSERPALDRIDLAIPANTTIGFVGTTGAGKTTIVDLVLGLLEPAEGELLVDDRVIGRESIRDWQREVGYVPQTVFLVDDTVAANIAFGVRSENIDYAMVERAARLAELHEFVTTSMPQGYQSRIGDRGVRLSGGQRQRIGIARALYHDPAVLVFDEATSALDGVTERAVMESIEHLAHQKTLLIIAHRLNTIRHCDRIYLLEKGQVAAMGTFDELLAQSGKFQQMVNAGP
jgi:ABC-type multidrug transport system fused ATPase/permease subunit